MLNCPSCNQPMTPDPNNPGKVLCYNCKKRYDEAKVAAYWGTKQPAAPQQDPQLDPFQNATTPDVQPAAQPPQYDINNPYAPTQQPTPYGNYPGAPKTNLPKGMAVASLVLGILCLLGSMFPFVNVIGIIMGIVAIILGAMTLKKVKVGTASGKGLGIAGIVTSAIGIVLSLVITVTTGALVGAVLQEAQNENINIIELMQDGEYTPSDDASGSASKSSSSEEQEVIYNDNAAWTSMKFNLNGQDYELGVTKLSDLASSGWTLDLAAAGYNDGYMVEANQMVSVITLTNPADANSSVYVNVVNDTPEPRNIMDCEVSKISVSSYGEAATKMMVGGISVGDDINKLNETFGNPQDIYEGSSGYIAYDYYTRDYDKTFEATAYDGGVIEDMSLSIL